MRFSDFDHFLLAIFLLTSYIIKHIPGTVIGKSSTNNQKILAEKKERSKHKLARDHYNFILEEIFRDK